MTKKQAIRAIVINPYEKTITEIQMPNDFEAMKRDHIKCSTAEVVDLGSNVDAWIDEDGYQVEPQSHCRLAGMIHLAGNVVLIGRDKQREMCALPDDITLELIVSMTDWPNPKNVPRPKITVATLDANGNVIDAESFEG